MSIAIAVQVIPLILGLFALVYGLAKRIGLREQLRQFGLSDFSLRDIIAGLAIGGGAILAAFLVASLLGFGSISAPSDLDRAIGGILLTLFVAAAFEELLFRGMMFAGLRRLHVSDWVIVALSALLFGLAHISNDGATALSVASTVLGGVMYGYAYIKSGSLWLPFGIHFAWNSAQGPILGLPVSGSDTPSLLLSTTQGPALITGGDYGVEGGLIGISARILVILAIFLLPVAVSQASRKRTTV